MIFRDREHAGELLAEKLERLRPARPVVLGLPRGGVPVAAQVARALEADLDVLVVRKLGAPGSPEYALGAIAEEGAVYVCPEALSEVGIGEADLAALAEREAEELRRRVRAYRGGRPAPRLEGRSALVVDDGVATGATARAAARAARRLGATRVVLAAPVIAAAAEPELRHDFDEVVAVDLPERFMAVGLWYERFDQVTDDEVVRLLRSARGGAGGAEAHGPAEEDPPAEPDRETVAIPLEDSFGGEGILEAELVLPEGARGVVLFVHGSGSSRRSPRTRFVARAMREAGFATLTPDLLTREEAAEEEASARHGFDLAGAARRVLGATRWLAGLPRARGLRLGYFGASTGAAVALAAAAEAPERVAAVVSRGGRPDLVPRAALERVRAPVLLVVGSRDAAVLELNRATLPSLARAELAVVPGASHLFEEPGALQTVARLAEGWFARRFEGELAILGPAAPR